MALLRGVTLTAIFASVCWLVLSKHRTDTQLGRERAELLQRWQGKASALSTEEHALTTRVAPWVLRAAGKYQGDHIARELQGAGKLAAVLKRPMVYLRGSSRSLSQRKELEQSARDSTKDALLLCLLDPPKARTEKALLKRTRSALSGSERMRQATQHVEPLGVAVVGLPVLDQAWRERVATADDSRAVDKLRRVFEQAPLESAQRAAQAPLLLVAVDEPGERTAPAELDGERPHHIRLQLIDLGAKKTLLRLRKRVSPDWLTDPTRAQYARGVDSCTFAFDVREDVAGLAKGKR
jgi:hypothetical protein